MISISPSQKIYICLEAFDFRKGFNATAGACRALSKDHLNGSLFVFINKNRKMLRLYLFDGRGEFLLTKRSCSKPFDWPKSSEEVDAAVVLGLLMGHTLKSGPCIPWKKISN